MCVCNMHGYGGEFTFPATVGRIVAHVAEGVYAHHPFTYIYIISMLIAPKPGLGIKKYSVEVFRSGGEVSLLYSEVEASYLHHNSLANTTLLALKRYAANKGIVASKHYNGKKGFAGVRGGSTTP